MLRFPIMVTILVYLVISTPQVSAQAPAGIVSGTALTAEDAPLSFALMSLVALRDSSQLQVLADDQGRFRFGGIAPGIYRLDLDRVGYHGVSSDPFRVEAGRATVQDVRAALEPIRLEALTVYGAGSCLSGAQVYEDAELSQVWQEAQEGMRIRQAFDARYRYSRTLRQNGVIKQRVLRDRTLKLESTVVNEPDSVEAREARRRAAHATQGYATRGPGTFTLSVPNEKEVLADEFLEQHCLDVTVGAGDGVVTLRFKPTSVRKDVVQLRGTITLDASTYAIRRMSFEYLVGSDVRALADLEYGDVNVHGAHMRLPVAGHVRGWPDGPTGLVVTEVVAAVTFDYQDFVDMKRTSALTTVLR